ncbi:MAG: HAD family hydrolase [Beutenbergiaceae bacterium]
MSALRGVVFDLDGTLIDSEPLWAETEIQVAASGGVHWSQPDADAFFGKPLRSTAQAIVDAGHPSSLDQVITAMLDVMESVYQQAVPWLPGSRRLLQQLDAAQIRTGIATMSFRRLVLQVAQDAPHQAVSVVVGGDEVSQGKPAPDVFLAAIERLSLTPDQVVVVEDSPTGAAAGLASGAAVVAIPPDESQYRALPAHPRLSVLPTIASLDVDLLRQIHAGASHDLWRIGAG